MTSSISRDESHIYSSFSSIFSSPMPKSEIDDIFASKGKAKPGPSIASTSTASPPPEKKKKKKDKKRQREEDVAPVAAAPEAKVARKAVPETIVDPSLGIASTASSAKQLRSARTAEGAPKVKKAKTSKADAGREDEERFKDSRGTGPRESRRHACYIRCVSAFSQAGKQRKDSRFTRRTSSECRAAAAVCPIYMVSDKHG